MNLLAFISGLEKRRDILEIGLNIDPRLELAAITDWLVKRGGPALRFQRLEGSDLETVTNLFGSESRMAAALGHERLADFGARLSSGLAQGAAQHSTLALRRLLPSAGTQSVPGTLIPRADLSFLPQFRFWAAEQRAFFTLAVVITRDPESAQQNYGIYRIGLAGKDRLTLNLLPHSGGRFHLRQWQARGQKMPVAILLGADPALIFAAAASLPSACDEAAFSAWIQSRPLEFVESRSVPLNRPASTQILIEGWCDPAVRLNEGPFGCFSGSYGGGNDCPLVEVSAVSGVECPLIPQTLAGPLPMEDSWLARANLEILQARLRIDLPQITSLQMPLDAAFYGLYFVKLQTDGVRAAEIAHELQKLKYLRHLKMLVVLDDGEALDDEAWRGQVEEKSPNLVWQESSSQLEALLSHRPGRLHHDSALLDSVLDRLRQTGINLEKL